MAPVVMSDKLLEEQDPRRVHGVCVGDGPDWLVCVLYCCFLSVLEAHNVTAMCVFGPRLFPILS